MKTNSPWPSQAGCNAFYGNPSAGGHIDHKWYTANIVLVTPPYPMHMGAEKVTKISIHKKCAPSLLRVLTSIAHIYGADNPLAGDMMEHDGVKEYDGAFCFRKMRGSNHLSMHSWGCAIDIDAAHNPFGGKPRFTEASRIVRAFEAENWTWGGHWSHPDGMHFQAAQVS
jgi:hypothetical protein